MGDLMLRSMPMFLAPAPIGGNRRSSVAPLRHRFGGASGVWGLCLKRRAGVGASDLELVYSTERSDGSVVFRFGTASEVAEYLALKKVESEGVEEVEDVTPEENVASSGEEETVEGFAGEVVNNSLFVEMQEDEIDFGLGSIENLSGVRNSSDNVGVSNSLDLILEVPVPSVHDDKNGRVLMEKVSVGENSMSNEIAVGSENTVSTFEKTGDSFRDFELASGIENFSAESRSVLVGNSESNSEADNVNGNSSADDFGGNVGDDIAYSEYSNASYENADSNAFKESEAFKSINPGEDSVSYVGDESTIIEEDIIVTEHLDPMAPEPDAKAILSLDKGSSFVDNEYISIHSTDGIINSLQEDIAPILETVENLELSSVGETRVSAEDFENDDKEIPVVNVTLNSNEEMAWDSHKEYVDLQKSSTSEVFRQENIRDDVSVVEQPSAGEITNQKDYFQTKDASSSFLSIVPASLSTTKGGFSDKCSNKPNMIQETVAIATSSINEEATNGSNSVAIIPVASKLENKIIVDERINEEATNGSNSVSIIPVASQLENKIIVDERINEEATNGSNYVAIIPVASQLENKIIVDERINEDSEEVFLSTTGMDSLNLASEKTTQTSEVNQVSKSEILGDIAKPLSVSTTTEQIPVQVSDREEASAVGLCLSIGAALLPKISEALTGGEDAYFTAGETWFGVADGEGQWSLEGVDAGLYGHELMECCRRIVSDGVCSPTNTNEVLSRSAAEAMCPGSATVLVAYFDGQVLHASNIGDTGFVIVRNGAILSRSKPTVHDFHFPHQIQKGDNPLEFVEVYGIELNEGDIIVAATDGLFDNMYDQEIASVVTKSLQANLSPEEVAAVLAVKAQEIGRSTSTRSPFADAAQAAGYAGCTGGKVDDVTIVISVVRKKS